MLTAQNFFSSIPSWLPLLQTWFDTSLLDTKTLILLVAILLESFRTLPIGQFLIGETAFTNLVAWTSLMFAGALLLALPIMAALLFVHVGLGVVTRAAPSLNIFAVGFAAMIPAGLLVMIISMTHIGHRIEWLWLQSFLRVRNLLGITGG